MSAPPVTVEFTAGEIAALRIAVEHYMRLVGQPPHLGGLLELAAKKIARAQYK